MKTIITNLIFLAFLFAAMSADGQSYSLQDCLTLALENNQNFRNSQLDVKAAEYRIKELKSALLPTVNITAQSLYYYDLPAQYAPASSFGGPDGTYNKLTLGMEQNTSANIQGSQNLYNHSVRVGLKAAKAVQEASVLQAEVSKESIIYNVTSTYYSIQVLNDNLQRLEENIANLEKTTEINGIMKDNELVSSNTHHRMLINLENLRNQYENQKLMLDKNMTFLKYLMSFESEKSLSVEPFDYNAVITIPEEGEISSRPDIRLQQSNLRIAELDKKGIAAGYYPVVTNSFSFGYSGYNDRLKPFDAVNNDWIRTSYVALTIKIPVFDGFQKQNQIRQKEIAIQKNVNTLSLMRNNAQREVRDAWQTYTANRNLLTSNKKSLELAEELFQSSTSEYENGITSLTELLNAQNDLTNARTNFSTALLNLKLAELALKKANGTLLTNQ